MRSILCRRSRVPIGHDEVDDRGVSLIEVLIAIVLLGVGGVATMSALGMSIRGSSTHEDKVGALAALESAAAVLREQVTPRTAEAYRSAGAEAISDPEFAATLTVSGLVCGDVLDELQLGVTSVRGLVQTLDVTAGGPRVADTPGGGQLDDTALPIVYCSVTSVSAAPVTMELSDIGLLTDDVRVEARTSEVCSGSLRAVFTPAPIDPATGLEWRPSFQEVEERRYELILTAGTFAWQAGTVHARIENRMPDDSFVHLGDVPGLFTSTCRSTVAVSNPSPQRHDDGQLLDDLTITVDLNSACGTPSSISFSIETGSGSYTGDLAPAGATWIGTIPGHAAGGPVFAPGTRVITFETNIAIEPIQVEVQ